MRAINHKIRLSTATLLAMVLGSYLYSVTADAAGIRDDISRANRSIHASAEERVGDIHLYREVDLYIDDAAEVGEIIRHY